LDKKACIEDHEKLKKEHPHLTQKQTKGNHKNNSSSNNKQQAITKVLNHLLRSS